MAKNQNFNGSFLRGWSDLDALMVVIMMIRLGSRANDSFLMSSPGSLLSLTRSPTEIHLEGIINNCNGNNDQNNEKNIRNIKNVDDNNYDHFCGPPWIVAKSRNVYQGRDKKKIVPICPRNCGRQISTAELLTTPCFAFLHRRKLYFSNQDNLYFFWVAFFYFLVGAVVYLQRNDHISPHNTICSARRVGNVYLVHSHIFRSYNSLHLASSGWGLPWNTKQISKW